jgi:hypothetical protein
MQSIAHGQLMRRTVPFRTTLHAMGAAALLLTAWPAATSAEEAPDLVISIVTGLAPDDLLNVRAKASPIAKVETRLAGGASVTNLGCNDVNGHKWCKVEETGNPKLSGWAPARYLIPLNPAPYVEGAAPPAGTPVMASTGSNTEPEPATAQAIQQTTAASGAGATSGLQSRVAPAPDLTARLGGVPGPAVPDQPRSAAATAMQDAYGLALAATAPPGAGEMQALAQPPVEDAASAGDAGAAADAAAAGPVPVPSPRPVAAEAPALDTQIVAELPPQPETLAGSHAVEISCARYTGQPMGRCAADVVRKGADTADVTVTWPDGGTRVISFLGGLPAGSNARDDFRYTREGSLSMIRVGLSERFEITDAVAFGN